ncbi:glycine betaine ABC transporter substrate-binding protein [Treponema endosymbiont of Eucomonympha sp.]|uniref:glycine betaine ABC transporter substrate-binding protein n=1 Tax=Treponema endosymbiont of Eucomonympha sp. TaxID=1580831 RepID=UPI0007839F8F|nr:glycine betaine ABC transporter substrate-binding protein [Treponema endosymbiont of Eucomonympha sp.]
MKRTTKTAAALLFAAVVAGAAFAAPQKDRGKTQKVRIGSKNFTENLILAEIYALALEDAGIPVERTFDLASSVVHTALTNNSIDLYPEYTGTGLLVVLKLGLETDPDEVYRLVKEGYKKQFDIVWLNYAKANDGQGVMVSKAASDKYGIRTISDLQRNARNIRFASQGEFDEREDALPRLIKIYGPFRWKSSNVYADSLRYPLLSSGKADAAPAWTTDGHLTDPQFVLLDDDKQAWPPYNIAPVVRQNVLDRYPRIADILNAVDAKIDTPTITALNAKVDADKREYAEVAKEFYVSTKR